MSQKRNLLFLGITNKEKRKPDKLKKNKKGTRLDISVSYAWEKVLGFNWRIFFCRSSFIISGIFSTYKINNGIKSPTNKYHFKSSQKNWW